MVSFHSLKNSLRTNRLILSSDGGKALSWPLPVADCRMIQEFGSNKAGIRDQG